MDATEFLLTVVRYLAAEIDRAAPEAATVLEWARTHAAALGLQSTADADSSPDERTSAWRALEMAEPIAQPELEAFAAASAIADAVALDGFDRRLLSVVVGLARQPVIAPLVRRLRATSFDGLALAGALAGADPSSAVAATKRTSLFALGLIEANDQDEAPGLVPSWLMTRLIDRSHEGGFDVAGALFGLRTAATLDLGDFADRSIDVDLARRLLAGAIRDRAAGVNILLHGPPGTGKTEFAKTLAAAVGADLYAVGETDEDGDEPTRWERVAALRRAQRALARRGGTVLLFDEMEDFIGETERAPRGAFNRREGSKVFVNRMLETNAAPVIWTTNTLETLDAAYLRRMSLVLKLATPNGQGRRRLMSRLTADERVEASADGLIAYLDAVPEAATVARVALRGARLAGGGEVDAEAIAAALVAGLNEGMPVMSRKTSGIDLSLYSAAIDVPALFDRLTHREAPADFALLLTGPPGTGKTALAGHLADRLGRRLIVKRSSDLMSKWVGETEKNIAAAFAEARAEDGVLLFDEIDSLLFDRSTATRSWEVGQVNELLTWIENHPLPFIAATNYPERLDPAAARRFTFKLALTGLSADGAARAFARFFGSAPPPALADVGGLTVGDFAVVARQLRFGAAASSDAIVALLEAETRTRPGMIGRLGF